jgi:CPA2 family monovalent cation:H+ antiporter-2
MHAEGWKILLDLLLMLVGALAAGLVCERIGISSILGYLAAGVALGPSALKLIASSGEIALIAEIGVALLLFALGLEFSFRRLMKLGAGVIIGGALSVVLLLGAGTGVLMAFGVGWREAVAFGAAISLSSTALVIRILRQNREVDSRHGRTSVGVLLVQDVMVVPLVILVGVLGNPGQSLGGQLAETAVGGLVLAVGLTVAAVFVAPRVLNEKILAKNRELPILVAVTAGLGAAWAAHEVGLSPALGAFLAGMLLADAPYSEQMRSDVLPLRTLLVTIFFVSVGLQADLGWMAQNLGLVAATASVLIVGKVALMFVSLKLFQRGAVHVMASSLALAQVGEFAFVLGEQGRSSGILSEDLFQLLVASSLVTLFIAPFMVTSSHRLARGLSKRLFPLRWLAKSEIAAGPAKVREAHVIIVGFGEAGQLAAASLRDAGAKLLVIDLNPALLRMAEEAGDSVMQGDATQSTILEEAGIHSCRMVVVALPAFAESLAIVQLCKSLAPTTPVAARSRYHLMTAELDQGGADIVVDEELLVGRELGACALATLPAKKPQKAS